MGWGWFLARVGGGAAWGDGMRLLVVLVVLGGCVAGWGVHCRWRGAAGCGDN